MRKKRTLIYMMTAMLIGCLIIGKGKPALARAELPPEEYNRKVCLVALVGDGNGEVGLSYHHKFDGVGPAQFAVTEGGIYILDVLNERIGIWKRNNYRSIGISACSDPTEMLICQDKLAVRDGMRNETRIYSQAGEEIALIVHPEAYRKKCFFHLHSLGENTVTWESGGDFYSYNWNTGLFQIEEPKAAGAEEDLFYWTYNALDRIQLYKTNGNGVTVTTSIDDRDWYSRPSAPFYQAEDGKLYVMECFEHYVVISEILFDTYSRYLSENAAVQWLVSRSLEMQEVERCRME